MCVSKWLNTSTNTLHNWDLYMQIAWHIEFQFYSSANSAFVCWTGMFFYCLTTETITSPSSNYLVYVKFIRRNAFKAVEWVGLFIFFIFFVHFCMCVAHVCVCAWLWVCYFKYHSAMIFRSPITSIAIEWHTRAIIYFIRVQNTIPCFWNFSFSAFFVPNKLEPRAVRGVCSVCA